MVPPQGYNGQNPAKCVSSTDQCADNGLPGTLQLVVVVGEEFAVAHLHVHHLISQLWHIHTRRSPAHLHARTPNDKSHLQPQPCRWRDAMLCF